MGSCGNVRYPKYKQIKKNIKLKNEKMIKTGDAREIGVKSRVKSLISTYTEAESSKECCKLSKSSINRMNRRCFRMSGFNCLKDIMAKTQDLWEHTNCTQTVGFNPLL